LAGRLLALASRQTAILTYGQLLSSLLPYKPSGGRGKSRLNAGVEEIVKATISEHFLTRQQRTVRSTSLEVARRCREAQLRAPNANTVRVRIASTLGNA
jgi:putative transposase